MILGILLLALIIVVISWASSAKKKNKLEIEKLKSGPELNYNDELLKLATLKEKGAITEDEFNISKAELNGGKVKIVDLKTLNKAKERGEITQEEYLQLAKKY